MKVQIINANIGEAFAGSFSIFVKAFLMALGKHNDTNLPAKCPIAPVTDFHGFCIAFPPCSLLFESQDTYFVKNFPYNRNTFHPLIPAGRYKLLHRYHYNNETIFSYNIEMEVVHKRANRW